jgi:hypothetical protein
MITLNTKRCSMRLIDDGGERSFADSGELLREGMVKLAWCSPPLDDLLLLDDQQSEELLPDHLLELGVPSIDGGLQSSGEILGLGGEDREGMRGRRRKSVAQRTS